jgi:hypothetical protein
MDLPWLTPARNALAAAWASVVRLIGARFVSRNTGRSGY